MPKFLTYRTLRLFIIAGKHTFAHYNTIHPYLLPRSRKFLKNFIVFQRKNRSFRSLRFHSKSIASLQQPHQSGIGLLIGEKHGVGLVDGQRLQGKIQSSLLSQHAKAIAVPVTGKLLLGKLKEVLYSSTVTKLAALSMKKQLGGMKKQFDASEYGGSPILGISKPVIKAHGSSDAKAFKNAIRQAISYADSGAIYDIAASAQAYAARKKAEAEAQKAETSEAEKK